MVEVIYKEIDGVKYACHMMPATMAQKVWVKLVEIVGRPAVAAIATGVGSRSFNDVKVDHMTDVASGVLFENLDPDIADKLCKELLTGVLAEDVEALTNTKVFDEHFRGRILHLYKVVFWSIQTNYQDFANQVSSSKSIGGIVELVKKYAVALVKIGEEKAEEKDKDTELIQPEISPVT